MTVTNEYIGSVSNLGIFTIAENSSNNIIDNNNVTAFSAGGGNGSSGFTGISLLNDHEAYFIAGEIASSIENMDVISFHEVLLPGDDQSLDGEVDGDLGAYIKTKDFINQTDYIDALELANNGDVLDEADYIDYTAYEEAMEDLLQADLDPNFGDPLLGSNKPLHISSDDYATNEAYITALEAELVTAGITALDPNDFVDADAYQHDLEREIEGAGDTLPAFRISLWKVIISMPCNGKFCSRVQVNTMSYFSKTRVLVQTLSISKT